MSGRQKIAIWAVGLAALGGILATVFSTHRQPITLKGAVIRKDSDANKQLPIADAAVSAANGLAAGDSKSDSTGAFRLVLRRGVRPGQKITLQFRHADYQPLDLEETAGDKIYIAQMTPVPQPSRVEPNRPLMMIANVTVRYSVNSTTAVNIGSAVKTFEAVNTGNVPCNDHPPCSPDGKWKAVVASTTLDAGEGNEFRNARASCIAGPCPFTRIESNATSQGGRSLRVSVRNWSDTATFLLEAEVFRRMVSGVTRNSYPVIFGQALNFTLPVEAEGASIEAELDGADIVFPLGPNLCLSWADCNARVDRNQTKVYRCELKAGYRFR